MKWLFLLCSCLTCFAQFPYSGTTWKGPATALTPCQLAIGTGYPTNITGYPAYTWWISQCGYTTNAGTATLTDFSANALHLTQATLGNAPIGQSSVWGGFDGVLFGSTTPGSLINNTGFSIPAGNQCEFWCIMSYTNIAGKDRLFHNVSANNVQLWVTKEWSSGNPLTMLADVTSVDVLKPCTNKYVIFDFVFTQGANATAYTNNVQGASGNIGSSSLDSFRLCGGINGNNGLVFSFLEGGWFRTNLTTLVRSNLFYYGTNKYSLPP